MIPEAFLSRMKALLGDEYDRFSAELDRPAVKGLRVNPIKITLADFEKVRPFPCEKIPYLTNGYYTEIDRPGNTPLHHAGAFYMQDPGAMATVEACPPKPGDRVLDTCAAPGGKTTQLSERTGDTGIVVANEYVGNRARILQGNVERLGCRNVVVTNLDVAELAKTYPAYFDYVLTDAPCSGEGMFRKNETAIDEWSIDNVKMCAERQRAILENASKCVRPGGKLVYSTCTFSTEENEENVVWFLKTHPHWHLLPVSEAIAFHTAPGVALPDCGIDLSLTRRMYPHVTRGEGQFVAVFSLDDDAPVTSVPKRREENKNALRPLTKAEQSVARAFLRETVCDADRLSLLAHGETVVIGEAIPLPAYGVYSAFVPLGTIQKGRVVPHHHFFSAYGDRFLRRAELDDASARAYLSGLTVPSDISDGWCVVTANGCALGGGKAVSGTIKNHYPKGLRTL